MPSQRFQRFDLFRSEREADNFLSVNSVLTCAKHEDG